MRLLSLSTALVTYCIIASNSAFALNQPTHGLVNTAAAQQSSVNTILRNNLNLPEGLNQRFRDRPVLDWIYEGGIREDDGLRFFRHFHDPLKPWDTAGLQFFGQFQSSIRWMQRPADCPDSSWRDGKDWAWSDARCYLRRALTESKTDDRDLAWAYTFRAVGQLMHLVVDASVPEHTRNDPHPLGGLFGSYEYWVQQQHGRRGSAQETAFNARYLAMPKRPDPGILGQPTNDPAAVVPIARLIDADLYTGADPNVTLTSSIGIAEFANANFFSEDSGYRQLLGPNYPHPSVEQLVPSTFSPPTGSGIRAYYKKGPGDGLLVDPVLAECAMDAAFRDEGFATPQYKCADHNVWEQTASFMLPRAVGYAAALLDYFFRGHLAAGLQLRKDGGTFQATLSLTNRTPGETMSGTFAVYVDTPSGERSQLPGASWNLALEPDATSAPLTFAVPGTAPVGSWLVVFQGTLGLEVGAVAVGRVVAPELVGYLSYKLGEETVGTNPPLVSEIERPLYPLSPSDWRALTSDLPLTATDTVSRSVTLVTPPLPAFGLYDEQSRIVFLRHASSGASRMTATVLAYPFSDCTEWDQLLYYHYLYTSLSTSTYQVLGPAIAEIVELPTPQDLATFYSYTYRTLPSPVRTLLTVSGGVGQTSETIDVAGVTFFGLRLLTLPEDPGQLPLPPHPEGYPARSVTRSCLMVISVRFEEPSQ